MTGQLAILVTIGLTLIGVIGDYFLKLAGIGPKYVEVRWFILGSLLYASTAIGWFFVLKHIKLGSLGIVYGVTIVISLALVGVIFFNERLNSYEILGLVLGLVALFLLARFA